MATLNLTTADNYQTITVNGTTIKQLWAKQGNNSAVKVYQKWKDESYNYTYYTNEAGSEFYGVAQSLKGYYYRSGWGNSYATYYGNIYIGCNPVSGRLVNGNAYIYGTFNGIGASHTISDLELQFKTVIEYRLLHIIEEMTEHIIQKILLAV